MGGKNKMSYDITYSDLNPTLLFAGKQYATGQRESHKHDRTEILCILSGNQHMEVNGTIYPVSSGDIIILNPGTMHHTIINEVDPALVFLQDLLISILKICHQILSFYLIIQLFYIRIFSFDKIFLDFVLIWLQNGIPIRLGNILCKSPI